MRAATNASWFRIAPTWIVVCVLAACDGPAPPAAPSESPVRADAVPAGAQQIEAFLAAHWARPVAPQGDAPARFSATEAALDPNACAGCHAAQFNDWRTSFHARAMGPGIMGQLVEMAPDARDEHQDCLRCHAPLAEQADSLSAALSAGAASPPANRGAQQPLHEYGLMCAGCHVRGHVRYGPPRRDGSVPGTSDALPHGGWIGNVAFEDSRFCAACHQFDEDGFALNGKLLENTYEEWRESRYAKEGKTCQTCHMPDRRHLWRGIHDPEMVRAGVMVSATQATVEAGRVAASLMVRNTGTGHYFPTYVTPKVVVEAFQEDARGNVLEGSWQEYPIARQVALDLSSELADSRIAPDEARTFDYRAALAPEAVAIGFRVRVEPDAFYTDFYRALLDANPTAEGSRLIRRALDESLASHFTLFATRLSIPRR